MPGTLMLLAGGGAHSAAWILTVVAGIIFALGMAPIAKPYPASCVAGFLLALAVFIGLGG